MELMLLSIVVSIAILAMAYTQQSKKKVLIEEIISNNTFQVYDYARGHVIGIVIFGVIAAIASYFAFQDGDEIGVALAIVLLSTVVGEPIINYQNMRFYYNDTSCILDGKLVRYRSIKEFRPKAFNVFKQQEVVTMSGEKHRVEKKVADLIKELMNKDKKK